MRSLIKWLAEMYGVHEIRTRIVEKIVEVPVMYTGDVIEGDLNVTGELLVKGEVKAFYKPSNL